MNTQFDKVNKYEEWIELNYLFIEDLKEKELTTNDTKRFFRELTKGNIFGSKIIIKILESYRINSKSAEKPKFVYDAVIIQLKNSKFIECKHPLKEESAWIVTIFNSPDKKLKKGAYYEVNYSAANNPEYMSQLIKIDTDSCESIEDMLTKFYEGRKETLYSEEVRKMLKFHFDENVQNYLINQLFESKNKKIKEKEQQIKALIEQLKIEENELEEIKKKLELERKELANDHTKKILIKNQQHKKKMSEKNLKFQNEIQALETKQSILASILLELRTNETILATNNETIYEWNVNTNVSVLQYLIFGNSDQVLYYDEVIIEMFLRALQTNAITILSGPSGTGKTSLVNAFGNAFTKSSAEIIPVQSNWTDKQDLLGYFNSSEKRYVSTSFLEALLKANESDGLYIICLDEMNLSHVEYYFAEFLSAKESNQSINLYPKRFAEEADEIILKFSQLENLSIDQEIAYRSAKELRYYPYKLDIPKNVRFVGTINMDHTVKPLSPKVIDRSFIIELKNQELNVTMKNTLQTNSLRGKLNFTLENFEKYNFNDENVEELTQWCVNKTRLLNVIPNAVTNSRSENHIRKYLKYIKPNTDVYTLVYQIFLSKILPRIHFSNTNQEASTAFDMLIKEMEAHNYIDIVDRLYQMKKSGRYISFFN